LIFYLVNAEGESAADLDAFVVF